MSARAELLLCVSLGLALTAGEMAPLTWYDVYDERGSVRQRVLVRAHGASLGRWVTVASPALREVLATYAERHAPWQLHAKTTPMFKSQKGAALSPASVTRLLSQLYREAGVRGGTLGSARRTIQARRQVQGVDLVASR
jgi:site-specific recombinase XerD